MSRPDARTLRTAAKAISDRTGPACQGTHGLHKATHRDTFLPSLEPIRILNARFAADGLAPRPRAARATPARSDRELIRKPQQKKSIAPAVRESRRVCCAMRARAHATVYATGFLTPMTPSNCTGTHYGILHPGTESRLIDIPDPSSHSHHITSSHNTHPPTPSYTHSTDRCPNLIPTRTLPVFPAGPSSMAARGIDHKLTVR